jgi:hypothetical protein
MSAFDKTAVVVLVFLLYMARWEYKRSHDYRIVQSVHVVQKWGTKIVLDYWTTERFSWYYIPARTNYDFVWKYNGSGNVYPPCQTHWEWQQNW